jgi:hypothetical protein
MLKEKIIKMAFNHKMERIARMLKLEISREDKTISLEVLLNGESTPIQITIGHYEIHTGEKNGIKISNIHTSREWMTELIHAFAAEKFIAFDQVKLLKLIL